jgi:type III secretion protein J
VFIKPRSEANLEALQPQVRRLVTNSIPGLTSDRVSTVLVPSAVALPESSASPSNVLGVRVESGSIWSLVALLIVFVLIAAATAGAGVYWFLRRSGRIGAAPGDRAPPAP